jgi:hypothetical protein
MWSFHRGGIRAPPCATPTTSLLWKALRLAIAQREAGDMKLEFRIAAIGSVILLGVLAQPVSAVEPNGFSNHSFRGGYALGIIGTVVGVGPVAGTGLLTSDGKGNFVGNETISYGVGPCVLTLIGTYSVNPDGTGTGTATVTSAGGGQLCASGNGSTVDFSFVLAGDRIKLSETSDGFAILAEGNRQ